MRKLSVILLPLLVLSCAGAGWYLWAQYSQLVALRAAVVDPTLSATLRKELAKLQKDLAADKKRLADLANPDAEPDPADADKAEKKKERRDAKREAAAIAKAKNSFEELMKDPEYRRLLQIQSRGNFDQRNAALLKAMNLSPEQTQKLHDLLMERDASFQDAYALAKEQGIDPAKDPKGFGAVMGAVAVDSTAQIKAAIGDDGYAQYQKLSGQRGEMAVANQLATSLSYTAAPLTAAQVSQLAAIFQQNPGASDSNAVAVLSSGGQNRVTLRGGNIGIYTSAGSVQGVPPLSDAAVTAAAGVLSPAQLDALKQLQQLQQSQLQLGQILAPALAPKATSTTGTTTIKVSRKG